MRADSLRRFLLGPARRDTRRLARHLRVDGRPRRVLQAGREVALGHVEQRLERLRPLVDVCPRVALLPRRAAAPSRSSARRDRCRRARPTRTASTPARRARARTDHAPNTVLCGAFWLKSMKMRSPRSSFHHASVIRSGRRRASSRATATAAGAHLDRVPLGVRAARTRGCRGCRWSSASASMPSSSSSARTSRAASRTSSKSTPGCGSRSMRSSSACSGSSARFGHTWKPRQPRFTAHAMCARSAATSARDVVPFGVLTIVVSSQSGASVGHPLLEERRALRRRAGSAASAPAGRPSRASAAPSTACVVVDEVELGLAPLGEHHLVGAGHGDRCAPTTRRRRARCEASPNANARAVPTRGANKSVVAGVTVCCTPRRPTRRSGSEQCAERSCPSRREIATYLRGHDARCER